MAKKQEDKEPENVGFGGAPFEARRAKDPAKYEQSSVGFGNAKENKATDEAKKQPVPDSETTNG